MKRKLFYIGMFFKTAWYFIRHQKIRDRLIFEVGEVDRKRQRQAIRSTPHTHTLKAEPGVIKSRSRRS